MNKNQFFVVKKMKFSTKIYITLLMPILCNRFAYFIPIPEIAVILLFTSNSFMFETNSTKVDVKLNKKSKIRISHCSNRDKIHSSMFIYLKRVDFTFYNVYGSVWIQKINTSHII